MGAFVGSYRWFSLALSAVAILAARKAVAEPVLDRALAGTQIFTGKGCTILKVNFNLRIRYGSHFPLSSSDELRVTVQPVDRALAAALIQIRREAARVQDGKAAAIKAVDFEADQSTGPVLRILFEYPVAYQVAPGPDFESIIIAIAGNKKSSAACRPEVPPGAHGHGIPAPSAPPVSLRPMDRPPGKASDADLRIIAASMDEGRAALRKSQFKTAFPLFTKVLRYPENQYSAEAQEFLGLAYQKDGQLLQARNEYEDYLRRYPKGEGNERVAQRLAGILTAIGEPQEKLRITKAPERRAEPGWSLYGSVSAFYIRDDSFRTIRDPSLPPIPNEDKDEHRVHQNTLLTSIDLFGTWTDERSKSKFRFSGSEEHSFDSQSTNSGNRWRFRPLCRDLVDRLGPVGARGSSDAQYRRGDRTFRRWTVKLADEPGRALQPGGRVTGCEPSGWDLQRPKSLLWREHRLRTVPRRYRDQHICHRAA